MRTICLSLALLLLGLSVPAVASQQESEADTDFARAVVLHQAGDVLGAIEGYRAVLSRAPEHVPALVNLGAALVRQGEYGEAIQHYEAALRLQPDATMIRFNLGLAYYKASRLNEASDELTTVVQADPANRNALLVLADCRLQLGDDRRVIELLDPRAAEFGDDRTFAFLLGRALINVNEVQRGQVLIDKLFRDESSPEAHLLLGAAYLQASEHRLAQQSLRRALELNPTLTTAHSLLGRSLMATGDQDLATAEFLKELEHNPNDFQSVLQLGNIRRLQQRFDDALTYLQRADALRPKSPAVLYSLGALYVATNRPEDAATVLESVVADVPEFTQAHVLLAQTYYRLKRKDDGDRHRVIADDLARKAQKSPGDTAGPADTPPVPPGTEP